MSLKKALLLVITIIILIGVSGCMNNNIEKEPMEKDNTSVKDLMMKHMEEKYNEKFEFVNIDTEVWTANYTEMILSSEKYPGGRIIVHRNKENGLIIDNYVDFLMKTKIEEAVGKIIAEIYPKSKVFYHAGSEPLSNNITPDMSIEDYVKARIFALPIDICVEDSEYETSKNEKLEQLRKVLEEKEYRSDLRIYYLKEGKLEQFEDSNWEELTSEPTINEFVVLRGSFYMDNSYKFGYSEWREIK
jgi:hypothetical protein